MGIHGLAKLIADHAPSAIKEQDIKNYFGKASYHLNSVYWIIVIVKLKCNMWVFNFHIFYMLAGRKIAIDASMCIYQFLIAVRQDGNVLQNEDGETTRYVELSTIICASMHGNMASWLSSKCVLWFSNHLPDYICMVIIFTQALCLPSHLMGMFYRTIRMLESGVKPVYVFDGKPPQLKSGEVRQKHTVTLLE